MQKYRDKIQALLTQSFSALSLSVPSEQVDSVTSLILSSMTGEHRFFHTPEHVLQVSQGGDAQAVIAALFHDLVYYQVDQSIPFGVAQHLAPFVEEKKSSLRIREKISKNPVSEIVFSLFGLKPGQKLSLTEGQNEFLSALAAACVLADLGATSLLLIEVVACIELTIPFRPEVKGERAPEILLQKILKLAKKQKLKISKEKANQIVKRAVTVGNRDVSGFGRESSSAFLADTWELVPETNPLLRKASKNALPDFQQALVKLERFFSHLDPEVVFQSFEGEPKADEYEKLLVNAKHNVQIAVYYFRIKLITLALLKCLFDDEDSTIALSLGELANLRSERSQSKASRLLALVSNKRESELSTIEKQLLKLFSENSVEDKGFGLKASPASAFLLQELGFDSIMALWKSSQAFSEGVYAASSFLAQIPGEVLEKVKGKIHSLKNKRVFEK
jgi:hypothetical protein